MTLLPFIFLASQWLPITFALAFAMLAVAYPMLRNLGAIPLDVIVADGRWILTFSANGWVGYLSEMGQLGTPIVMVALQARKGSQIVVSTFVVVLALILAITMVDMLLNDTLESFTWLIAGTLLGCCETQAASARKDRCQSRTVIGAIRDENHKRTLL